MAMSTKPKMQLEHGATVSIVEWPKDLQALYNVAKETLRIYDNSITAKTGDYYIDSEDAFQSYSAIAANIQATVMAITIETAASPTKSVRPVAVKSGLCWQDLFNEEGLPPVGWPSIAAVAEVVNCGMGTLSSDLRYKIEVTGKDRIHLVVSDDDEDGLSASEVLQQNPGLLIGGYTIAEHLREGGWDACVLVEMNLGSAGHIRSHSGSSTGSVGLSGDLKSFIASQCGQGHTEYYWRTIIARKLRELQAAGPVSLSRLAMEVIARLCNAYCWAAAVASSEDFIQILYLNYVTGDTRATFEMLLSRKHNADVTLHYSHDHISTYPFDNAIASIHADLLRRLVAGAYYYGVEKNATDYINYAMQSNIHRPVILDLTTHMTNKGFSAFTQFRAALAGQP
ncbi:hypothetical protein CPB85DRAFT_482016 [Mucidula mucida]|nr:hypothetical protein CPB85DRAFT_482016 [Mucidula mucida]